MTGSERDEHYFDTSSLLEDIDNTVIDVAKELIGESENGVLVHDGLQLGGSDLTSSSISLLKTILGAGIY